MINRSKNKTPLAQREVFSDEYRTIWSKAARTEISYEQNFT